MIRKIALATVLGAAVVYFIHTDNFDAPGYDPLSQLDSHRITAPQQVAATADTAQPTPFVDAGTEVVLGLRVRKDRDCRVELKDYVTTNGEMFSAYSCTPNQPAPPHIYSDYDNATLDAMSYADADAAALLGRRLVHKDTRKSYELLIRAAALDGGKIEHLAWLSDQAFGVVSVNGEPQVANLQRQYELAALAARLGDTPAKSRYLKNELTRVGVDADQLAKLDVRVDQLFESMRTIQLTVSGNVTIGGQDDA